MRALVRCCPASGYARHFTGGGPVYRGTPHQRGYGGIGVVYKGMPHQRGHGFGSFMKGLFRKAVPLLKKGASVLGKSAMRTAANVLGDVVEGRNIGESFGTRSDEAGRDLMQRAAATLKEQSGGGRYLRSRHQLGLRAAGTGLITKVQKAKKRKCCKKGEKKQKKRRITKEDLKGDIFSRIY